MKGKVLGIFGLLVALCIFMVFMTSDPWYSIGTSKFLQPGNIQNLLSRTAMFGILGIGVAFVIITSGIDLSIGSLVCMSGVLLAMFLHVEYVPQNSAVVTKVDARNNTFEVGTLPEQISEGDQIRYSGGRRASSGIFTVESVDGQKIVVAEPVDKDDKQGEISVVAKVSKIQQATDNNGYTVTFAKDIDVATGDKLTLAHPQSGLKTEAITEVTRQDGSTSVVLANDPGDRVTTEWLAVLQKREQRMPVAAAILLVLSISAALGLVHGLLVTRANLQPFVVTLCGLLIYRGLSRWLTDDNPAGMGEYSDTLCELGSGRLNLFTTANGDSFGIPYPFFFLVVTGIVAAIFLNRTIWGRYLFALGRNEQAARFSGINTNNLTLMAFVICSALAGLGGILFALDFVSISPSSFGNFFELYAIAAAVLGGCSLRGGEGSVIGVVIGTAVMQILNNMIVLLDISQTLEYTVIGSVLLVGVLADELFRKLAAERRRKQQLQSQ